MPYRVLLVCTGNTCRSPMAEAILSDLLKSRAGAFEISSAGLFAPEGGEANDRAVEVMREEGLDLSEHRTRRLTRDLVERADLILVMERSQRAWIKARHPGAAEKTFTIAEYAWPGEDEDIGDPIGGDLDEYRKTAAKLRRALEQVAEKLAAGPVPGGPGQETGPSV